MGEFVHIKRPTIARNTSGFTRQEIMRALKVCGKRPSGSLLLDLTKSADDYKGWCHSIGDAGTWKVLWTYRAKTYHVDCHIRLRVADKPTMGYRLRVGRGRRQEYTVSRWEALCLLLAHELEHWRQAARDGKTRCLQLQSDKAALRVARKLGLKPA